MLKDNKANFVYIADTLHVKFPSFYKELTTAFDEHGIDWDILKGTKDIWVRDYMPIQVSEDKYVRFTYRPDYLTQDEESAKTISDVDAICDELKIEPVKSNIVLDGGNISRWDDKVLMTTKVFTENPKRKESELIGELKDLLEVNNIFFVPVEEKDWLGHIDGMARFIDSRKVLINSLEKEKKADYIDFLMCLHNAGLEWEEFPFNPYNNKSWNDANGIYLNYLELSEYIVLPVFGLDSDKEAIAESEKIFRGRKIIPVMANQPAKENGVINCLTWSIRQ